MKNIFLIFLVGLLLLGCSSSPEPKTIYIVRHAEKMLVEDPDPELTQVGQIRAKKLAQILAKKEIKHVFSTDFKRTRLTGLPTAEQSGITIETYDPRDQEAFAEKLRALEGNILVVGHSNTAPGLATLLATDGTKFPDLTDVEYDNIYIIEMIDGQVSAVQRTYRDF